MPNFLDNAASYGQPAQQPIVPYPAQDVINMAMYKRQQEKENAKAFQDISTLPVDDNLSNRALAYESHINDQTHQQLSDLFLKYKNDATNPMFQYEANKMKTQYLSKLAQIRNTDNQFKLAAQDHQSGKLFNVDLKNRNDNELSTVKDYFNYDVNMKFDPVAAQHFDESYGKYTYGGGTAPANAPDENFKIGSLAKTDKIQKGFVTTEGVPIGDIQHTVQSRYMNDLAYAAGARDAAKSAGITPDKFKTLSEYDKAVIDYNTNDAYAATGHGRDIDYSGMVAWSKANGDGHGPYVSPYNQWYGAPTGSYPSMAHVMNKTMRGLDADGKPTMPNVKEIFLTPAKYFNLPKQEQQNLQTLKKIHELEGQIKELEPSWLDKSLGNNSPLNFLGDSPEKRKGDLSYQEEQKNQQQINQLNLEIDRLYGQLPGGRKYQTPSGFNPLEADLLDKSIPVSGSENGGYLDNKVNINGTAYVGAKLRLSDQQLKDAGIDPEDERLKSYIKPIQKNKKDDMQFYDVTGFTPMDLTSQNAGVVDQEIIGSRDYNYSATDAATKNTMIELGLQHLIQSNNLSEDEAKNVMIHFNQYVKKKRKNPFDVINAMQKNIGYYTKQE